MIKKIRDLDINYVQYGKGLDIVLLHGWEQNIQMMEPILDFPGFGSSQTPNYAYTIYDYATLLHELLESIKVEKPILIGHSFSISFISSFSFT